MWIKSKAELLSISWGSDGDSYNYSLDFDYECADATYKGWYIFLDKENGEILGVTIKHPKNSCWWSNMTENKTTEAEYHIKIAKKEIDKRQNAPLT